MIIFKSFENFCGFLFFSMTAMWLIGIVVAMIIYRSNEEETETEDGIQAFIDGVENAIDNGWDFTEEDFEEYKRLTEGE